MRPAVTKERGPQKACHDQSAPLQTQLPIPAHDGCGRTAYSSNSLHAKHKGILGQISRVAQTVLLPQLAKQVLHATHGPEVVGKVALEEGVNASTQHKPHDGGQVSVAKRRPYALDERVRDAEDGGATSSKHADQLQRVPFVGKVTSNLGLDGVVRVYLPREEGEVSGSHCARMGVGVNVRVR
jgi:hypothetical protein